MRWLSIGILCILCVIIIRSMRTMEGYVSMDPVLPIWAQSKPTRRMTGSWGKWPDVVEKNVSRLRAAEASAGTAPLDFVLYGDSITAFLNGYSMAKVQGSEAVWKTYFGDLRAIAAGVAGDQVGNVLWRIVKKERPAMAPKVIGLHVGINDLIGWGTGGVPPVPPTLERLKILIRTILDMYPSTHVMVIALTPCNGTVLREKRNKHNAAVKKMVSKLSGNVSFADCSASITAPNGGPSRSGILADGVHLSAAGHEAHLSAMRKAVDAIIRK